MKIHANQTWRAATVTMLGLTLLVAGCTGSPSSGRARGAGGSQSPSAVGYSYCVRSHGVPNFPDPPSGGGVAKASAQQLGVSSATLQAAETACQHLIPAPGGALAQEEQQCFVANDCSSSVVRQLLNEMLRFARCMRSHGEPNFPDPTTDAHDQPFFDASAHGISDAQTHAPQFIAKLDECQRQVGNFPYTFG
jgi:hypothetical protein